MTARELEHQNLKDDAGKNTGLVTELGQQLSDYTKYGAPKLEVNKIVGSLSDIFGLSDKERNEAITKLGKCLEETVKGDLSHLKDRMKELGLSTDELAEHERKLDKKIENAKPLEEAILKADTKALQKCIAEMTPEQLAESRGIIQKNFDKQGLKIDVDLIDGKLIVSADASDKAVAISKDKVETVGVSPDGSYNFNKQFRHADPAASLKGCIEDALLTYLHGKHSHDQIKSKPRNEVYQWPTAFKSWAK
jgi:hypothetical protein